MNVVKFRSMCRPFRIVLGLSLIITGIILANSWFFLGVIPLFLGAINICFMCMSTDECEVVGIKEQKKEEIEEKEKTNKS